MARLTLSLLGSFEVRLEGKPVTAFDSNKVRALLAYLAVEAERPHSREALAGLLWPDVPDRVAHTNLRNALANLRKAIHDPQAVPPHLFITRKTIQFNVASDHWLDVAAFQALVVPAVKVRAQGGRTEDLEGLEEALGLYRGPFLEGLFVGNSAAWEEWCLQVRERLDREGLEALEHVAAGYEQRGELERALGHARRQVEWAPWWEEGHRRLMRLLARCGQRSAALAQYEACRRALTKELDVEPDPETVRLYEQIRAGEATPAASQAGWPDGGPWPGVPGLPLGRPDGSRGNLPSALTSFVGRKQELANLEQLLADPEVRLVTVVGPGGSGKTRLALEAAAAEVNRYSHGVWFVSLASLQATEGIVPTVAQALGLPFGDGSEPRQQLLDYLRQKQMLLLLDNCEHLLEGGELLAEILRAAPSVRLLATSRVRLGLQGEYAFQLAGMRCPPEEENAPERLTAYSAAALFLAMAERVRPGWAPQGEDWAHIARLCRQVQGQGQALHLAAAWMDTLSPADIARRVARDLDFLETEWRDVPERQRSMRAVCDASWQLLTEREQGVFAALAICRGGFTAEAAQEVGSADVRALRSLVHKSFLQVEQRPARTWTPRAWAPRYDVHELLRQYALEKLDRFPDGGRGARERHATCYLAALKRWTAELKGPRQRAALGEMEIELGNLRVAWEWATERGRWAQVEQAAEGLALFYEWRGRNAEVRILFSQAAERLSALVARRTAGGPESIRVLVELLAWQARFEPDDPMRVRLAQRCRELLALPELAGQDARRTRALVLRTFAVHLAGAEEARARALLEESLALFRALGDRWAEAVALSALGYLEYHAGKTGDAGRRWEESLALFRALGEQHGIAICLYGLHLVYGWQGRFAEAERAVEERMALAREWGDLTSLAEAYLMLGSIRLIAGHFAEAIEVLEREYLSRMEELGGRVQWAYGSAWLGHARLDSGDYGAARVHAERSLALGREMNSWQAITAALPVLAEQALLEGRPEEASRLYREMMAVADEAGYPVLRTYYGGEWAAAELRLGRRDTARECLCTALSRAVDGRAGTMPIKVLPTAAEWLAAEGQTERAVEVYALALRYPHIANSHWYQDVFGPPMAAAAASLPPEVVQAAQARGRARDLEATVRELLRELGG
jgi:predicted ATPase/DNA-binding SARP family transcriptional activator